MFSAFNVFLCVVPCTACVGHEECQQHPTDGDTNQETTKGLQTDEADGDGCDHRDHAGQHHLSESAGCGDVDTFCIFRLCFSFQEAWNFSELSTNLFDHGEGCPPNGRHGERGEEVGQHGAEQNTCDDHRIQYVKSRLSGFSRECGKHGQRRERR